MESEIDGELSCDAPIVFYIEIQFIRVQVRAAWQEDIPAQGDRKAEQHGGDGVTSATRGGGIARVRRIEVPPAEGALTRRTGSLARPAETKVHTDAEAVGSSQCAQVSD